MTGSDIELKPRGFCGGYVLRIADAQDRVRNPTARFCFDLPSGLSKGQIFQVVKANLNNRPDSRRTAAETVLQEALDDAFLCVESRS